MKKNLIANIILGSYVNGYSIVQELSGYGVPNIIVMDVVKDVAAFSNKISEFVQIKNSARSILSSLKLIAASYDLLIIYPNKDVYLEHLSSIYPEIKDFCFVAFDPKTVVRHQDKMVQYKYCRKLGVPCPEVVLIRDRQDLKQLDTFRFPILIKPTKRDNLSGDVFRNLLLNNQSEFLANRAILADLLQDGINFVISEVIPGEGSDIHSYTAYRSKDGRILGEWIGRKLSQFPNDFGVFASASNQSVPTVLEQGRTLLHGMNLRGVNQPEFKYDHRDGKFKLMEINLRPMMWHRLGALSGVPLNYIQYLDASDQAIPEYPQDQDVTIHYIYLNYELINLIYRSEYFRTFWYNLRGGDRRVYALWDRHDPKPYFRSFISIFQRYRDYRRTNERLT